MPPSLPDGRLIPSEDHQPEKARSSALAVRNVSVHGRRTSIRLEPHLWDMLAEICRREFCTPHDVCSYADEHKAPNGSLASSLRIVILDYFRAASTEGGHQQAGHGQGMFLAQQHERRELRAMKAKRRERNGPDGWNPGP